METWFFAISLGFSIVLFGISVLGLQRGWFRVSTDADRKIADLERQIAWLTDERNQLISKILLLERSERELKDTIRSLREASATSSEDNRDSLVLGIWPASNLDVNAERGAVFDAGLSYRALMGDSVTRVSILRELRTSKVRVVEIGAHGDENGIFINGRNLSAGWWYNALRGRGVEVAILLACSSDSSVADAFKRAGVDSVIAIDGEISDDAAVDFAESFYQLWGGGVSVENAVAESRLVLDLDAADRVVLR